MSTEHVTVTVLLPSGVAAQYEFNDVIKVRVDEGCLQVGSAKRLVTYAPGVWQMVESRIVEED